MGAAVALLSYTVPVKPCCTPSSHVTASRAAGEHKNRRKDFAVSSSEKKMICSKRHLSDYAEDESATDQRDREQRRNLTGNIFL